MGFLGQYQHTLDPKGRVFVPKRLLESMSPDAPRHFVATRGFEGCVTLFTSDSWQDAVDKMKSQAQGERQTRDFKRMLFSAARQLPLDGSGRILVPEELRAQAVLKRDVMFIGIDDVIELWDLEKWTRYQADVDPDFEKAGERVVR